MMFSDTPQNRSLLWSKVILKDTGFDKNIYKIF